MRPQIGQHQQVVDLLGEDEADRERDADGDERPDQPLAQLDEMIDERRLGGVDVVLARPRVRTLDDVAHAAPLSGSSLFSAGGGSAGSLAGFIGSQCRRRRGADRGLRRVDVDARRLDLAVDGARADVHGGAHLAADGIELLLEAIELGFAHRLVELAAELGRVPADDAEILADGAQQDRQILGADDDQRDDGEDQQLAGGDVEHASSRLPTRSEREAPRRPSARPAQPVLVVSRSVVLTGR